MRTAMIALHGYIIVGRVEDVIDMWMVTMSIVMMMRMSDDFFDQTIIFFSARRRASITNFVSHLHTLQDPVPKVHHTWFNKVDYVEVREIVIDV